MVAAMAISVRPRVRLPRIGEAVRVRLGCVGLVDRQVAVLLLNASGRRVELLTSAIVVLMRRVAGRGGLLIRRMTVP